MAELAKFADTYKDLPTLAFTHFQPAQPTTVGKRATLWLQDLLPGSGGSGLRARFHRSCWAPREPPAPRPASWSCLTAITRSAVWRTTDRRKDGLFACYPVSGQTYSRKVDTRVLSVLAGIAQSAHKFSNDIRLLQHLKEVEEPFEKNQIGSSAMAYKRNPMRSERIASLANYVMADVMNPMLVASHPVV